MELRVDGRTAYAYTGGKTFDPALPCVVFVHGALNDHSVFTLLARWFAHHGHAVLALDLPGHRRSEGPPPASVEDAADWVLRVLDAAGVRHAAVVGHSLGSLIALEAAARAPERVTRLVMVGTAFPMKVSAALLDTARDDPARAIDQVVAYSLSTLAAKPAYPGPGFWLRGGLRAQMRRVQQAQTGLNLFHHDFLLCDRYARGLEAAAAVTCPSTLVLGTLDQMTPPRAAQALATGLRARVCTVAAGHALMMESPDGVLTAVRDALA